MELRQKIQKYFKLSKEQKDEVLVEIIKIYQEQNHIVHQSQKRIQDLIDVDIDIYTEEEEFELVQALTDIKTAINEVENDFRNGL